MPVTIEQGGAPPRKAARESSATTVSGNTAMSRKARERAEGLTGIGQLVYAGLLFAKQPADAGAVNKFWPAIAIETAKIADTNEKVAETLDKLNEVGPYSGLIMAVTPLIAQLLVNHNRVPAESVASLGVVSKSTLESEVQAEIMKAEMHAMQVELEIAEQRKAMQEEYDKARAQMGSE